jgi:hypothetical protein
VQFGSQLPVMTREMACRRAVLYRTMAFWPVLFRPAQDIADLEADAIAGAGRLGHEHITTFQPAQIAPKHVRFGERRLGLVDAIGEQVRGQHLVSERVQPFAHRPTGCPAAATAANVHAG